MKKKSGVVAASINLAAGWVIYENWNMSYTIKFLSSKHKFMSKGSGSIYF